MVNLIGISGYAGAGKDLVGRIIQYLTYKEVTYSDEAFKISYFQANYSAGGWEIRKYADKLKQIASILTGIPVEKFEDQEFKKTLLGEQWTVDKGPNIMAPMSGKDAQYKRFNQPLTVREFLQKLGTEAIRDAIHPNAWGNALFADYHPIYLMGTEKFQKAIYPNWIITDVRFQNEADLLKEKGGKLIYVARKGIKPVNSHPSETSLEGYPFHYGIENDGTIDELIEKVREILIDMQVLQK